jgi:hypothetical protein
VLVRRDLETLGIPVLDPLPALAEAIVTRRGIYPRSADGHPLAAGYEVYARTVYDYMSR